MYYEIFTFACWAALRAARTPPNVRFVQTICSNVRFVQTTALRAPTLAGEPAEDLCWGGCILVIIIVIVTSRSSSSSSSSSRSLPFLRAVVISLPLLQTYDLFSIIYTINSYIDTKYDYSYTSYYYIIRILLIRNLYLIVLLLIVYVI